MVRVLIGSIPAAIAMMIVALIFFASPLSGIAYHRLDDTKSAAVQLALAQQLPETATYVVPDGMTQAGAVAFAKGPVATIHYNSQGFSPTSGSAFLPGFIHMVVVALLLGFGLLGFSHLVTTFAERARILVCFALGASAYIHLADPIWMHVDWAYAIYLFIADAAALIVGGLILARWFLPRAPVVTTA